MAKRHGVLTILTLVLGASESLAVLCTDDALNASTCDTVPGRWVYTSSYGGRGTNGANVTGSNGTLVGTIPSAWHDGTRTCSPSDTNLTAANICTGQTIFGTAGSAICQSGGTGAAAAAAASHIVASYEAWSNTGAKMTGTITNRGSFDISATYPGSGYYSGTLTNTPAATDYCVGTTVLGTAGTGHCLPGTFAAKVTYAAGAGTGSGKDIDKADFNGDGALDIVTANSTDGTVSIFLGVGNGTFGAKTDYATGAGASSVTVADYNRDAKMDVIVANPTAGTISLLPGVGDGTLGAKTDVAEPNVSQCAVGDLNRDGKGDFICKTTSGGASKTYIGDGAGGFSYLAGADLAAVSSPLHLVDINRDGKLDVVATESNFIRVWTGNGDGTFSGPTSTAGVGTEIGIGDFNNDGKHDVVLVSTTTTAYVYLGNADGTFQAPVSYTVGGGGYGAIAVDLDKDGKQELLLAGFNSDNISVMRGNGNGTFQTAVTYASDADPAGLVSGDWNRDGKPDVVTRTTNAINVFLAN